MLPSYKSNDFASENWPYQSIIIVGIRVFSVLPFSGFLNFWAFENFVLVLVRAFGSIYSSKVGNTP